MIKIENTEVYGWEAAIRGMRNPMNSWDKSDSYACDGDCLTCTDTERRLCEIDNSDNPPYFYIGSNDLKLMKKLVAAGSDHSKFMRMINVTVDITAPLYFWKEFDTYKVGTVRNSCSTMRKIAEKPLCMSDFSRNNFNFEEDVDFFDILAEAIFYCEELRKKYVATKSPEYWRGLIQLLPESYNQRATVQLNYAVLRNMYHARKNHKLDEWRDFCKWIETLPYSELITMERGD